MNAPTLQGRAHALRPLPLFVPPLDLHHHREEVTDVARGDADRAVVVAVLVDDVDAVVALLVGLGPVEDGVELGLRGHREPVVVEARARHRVLVTVQEHELLERVGLEHEPLRLDVHHLEVPPAEHLGVEVAQRRAPFGREHVGRQAHRHMVEVRRACAHVVHHEVLPGTTITFAASSPSFSATHASTRPSSTDLVGLDEQIERQVARREQLERTREAVVVVDEAAGDHELVEQNAVRVELRLADSRAHEHRARRRA